MIRETISPKNRILLTSDQWHVLHARWTGDELYERAIVSEHADRASATSAAREFAAAHRAEMTGRTRVTRDQLLVRRPGHKSLKIAKHTRADPDAPNADPASPAERSDPLRPPAFGAGLDPGSDAP
jgi:hypothetical protein